MNTKPFAEVIESSLQGWLAQSWQWDFFPPFGSLVCIEQSNRKLFGIVHQVTTGSMDPSRYPFPYQKTEAELRAEQPQIFEFLKTTFSCIALGYSQEGILYHLIAPEPPKIHAFVQQADVHTQKTFFAHNEYLHQLFGRAQQLFNLDELLLALIKQQLALDVLSEHKIHSFMQTYILLVGNDYRRVKLFLQRVQQLLTHAQVHDDAAISTASPPLSQ